MTKARKGVLFAMAVALAVAMVNTVCSSQAIQSFSAWPIVPLENGANEFDIDGDGRQDLVFVAWRDNANAHGYNRISFYIRGNGNDSRWQIMPFFDINDQPKEDSFRTDQGADCQLRGIAVVRNPSRVAEPVTVIVAKCRSYKRGAASQRGRAR